MSIKPYEEIHPEFQLLVSKYQDILSSRAGNTSMAKAKENRMVIILLIIFFLLVIFLPKRPSGPGSGIMPIAFGVLFFFGALLYFGIRMARDHSKAYKLNKKYNVKTDVMKPMLDLILGQETEYLEHGAISDLISVDLLEEGIFKGLAPNEVLEDVIKAKFGETDVIFGEKKNYVEKQSGSVSERVEVTSLSMLVDFHKRFEGSMTVRTRDTNESLLDKWHLRDREVMGDARFDDLFVVHSSDPVLARYILSPSLLERLVDIIEKYKCQMALLFKEGSLHIQLDWNRNLLETDVRAFVEKYDKEINLFGKTYSVTTHSTFDNIHPKDISVFPGAFRGHYNDIAALYGLLDELRQNVRIWGK
jgi:hypothetical protein